MKIMIGNVMNNFMPKKSDTLDEMDKFTGNYKLPELTLGEIESLNMPIE